MNLSKEAEDALTFLAKRKNANYDSLIVESAYELNMGWFLSCGIDQSYDTCLICETRLKIQETYEHGFNHLKEHNLLAFL